MPRAGRQSLAVWLGTDNEGFMKGTVTSKTHVASDQRLRVERCDSCGDISWHSFRIYASALLTPYSVLHIMSTLHL